MTGLGLGEALQAAAVTVVFTQGSLFNPLRSNRSPWLLRELAKCALCSGVWVGMLLHVVLGGWRGALDTLVAGVLAGVGMLLHVVLGAPWGWRGALDTLVAGALAGTLALGLVRILHVLDAHS